MHKQATGCQPFLLIIFPLTFLSCSLRHPVFQVVPQAPVYLLRSPDLRNTPFPDVLRDYNGFEPGGGWVDLSASMELMIENAYYAKGFSRRGLQGFLGTEVARYQVRANGLRIISVQSMKDRPATDTPVQRLILPSMMNAKYYRLYFEVFNPANKTHVSVLLAANSKEELEDLSSRMDHPETVCNQASAHCTAFPEACSVSLEMKVVVNGKREMLVWGSLLNRVVGNHPQHLAVRRLFAGRLTPVEIDFRDPGTLQLPLLPGDHITWN